MKKLTLTFLIISFLVVGGAFEQATAEDPRIPRSSQSGMEFLELCKAPEDYKAPGETMEHAVSHLGQCHMFIMGVADTLGQEIFREELYRMIEQTPPPRGLCVPEGTRRVDVSIAVRAWLKNEFKKNGDLTLRFEASRSVSAALLEAFPCKELDKSLDAPTD
tara:strand:+ start:281 stop:766 length:486 start_codon:yes stop_codon:yes gene_type:complete